MHIKRPPCGEPLDRRFCWDLHSITLHGRKCLLAVHCASRYTFTLFDLTCSDLRSLPEIFLTGLRCSLTAAGVPEWQIAAYLGQARPPALTRTHGRREVAFLNRAWDDVVALDYTVNLAERSQTLLDHAVNVLYRRCAGYDGLGIGMERLLCELAALGGCLPGEVSLQ